MAMADSVFEQQLRDLRGLAEASQQDYDKRSLELRSAISACDYEKFDKLVRGITDDDDPDGSPAGASETVVEQLPGREST